LTEPILTQKALAKALEVSPERVRQWRLAGMPMRRIGNTWRIPEAEARSWLAKHKNDPEPTRAGSARGGAEPRAEAERRAAVAKADAAELELARRRSELIERDLVKREVYALARAERDSWQGWAARVAPTLAAELGVDHAALLAALEREVAAHLADLSEPEVTT
jgi:phage terminase Nu1 subunit (DNA packaging protein)